MCDAKGYDARGWSGIVVLTKHRGAGDDFSSFRALKNTITGVGGTGITTSTDEYSKEADNGLRISGTTIDATQGEGIFRGAVGARSTATR